MNQKICSLIILCFTVSVLAAQNDEILMTIGNKKIGLEEFERIYKKNNTHLFSEADKKSPEDYLDLFINFKLKVIEAENEKMDTSAAFINELKGYRKDLASSYLKDTNYEEDLAKEMYDRMTKEINASHILISVAPGADVETEKAALDKALKIKAEILGGKNFGEAAVKYSDDPSAKTNKGNLGYFTAFQMVDRKSVV